MGASATYPILFALAFFAPPVVLFSVLLISFPAYFFIFRFPPLSLRRPPLLLIFEICSCPDFWFPFFLISDVFRRRLIDSRSGVYLVFSCLLVHACSSFSPFILCGILKTLSARYCLLGSCWLPPIGFPLPNPLSRAFLLFFCPPPALLFWRNALFLSIRFLHRRFFFMCLVTVFMHHFTACAVPPFSHFLLLHRSFSPSFSCIFLSSRTLCLPLSFSSDFLAFVSLSPPWFPSPTLVILLFVFSS